MAHIRHIIAMKTTDNRAHPWTGSSTVFYNAEVSGDAAHPEWATKFKTLADARNAMRKLPARAGGYSVAKVAIR